MSTPAITHSQDYLHRVAEDVGVPESSLCTIHPGVPPPLDIDRSQAVENLSAILPALGHGLAKLRGDPADCGRPAEKGDHD